MMNNCVVYICIYGGKTSWDLPNQLGGGGAFVGGQGIRQFELTVRVDSSSSSWIFLHTAKRGLGSLAWPLHNRAFGLSIYVAALA